MKEKLNDPLLHQTPLWQRISIFAFGTVFISVLLIIAILFPNPRPFQYTVFRIVLALAAAGVAGLIPGFLKFNSPMISAGGALAVFVIVYKLSPAELITDPLQPIPEDIPQWRHFTASIDFRDPHFDITSTHTDPSLPSIMRLELNRQQQEITEEGGKPRNVAMITLYNKTNNTVKDFDIEVNPSNNKSMADSSSLSRISRCFTKPPILNGFWRIHCDYLGPGGFVRFSESTDKEMEKPFGRVTVSNTDGVLALDY